MTFTIILPQFFNYKVLHGGLYEVQLLQFQRRLLFVHAYLLSMQCQNFGTTYRPITFINADHKMYVNIQYI